MSSAVRIEVFVQPRAGKTERVGLHDGHPKIRLAAPPVDGAANAALIEFVAQQLKIAKSRVRIVGGRASRRKILEIEGVTIEAVQKALHGD